MNIACCLFQVLLVVPPMHSVYGFYLCLNRIVYLINFFVNDYLYNSFIAPTTSCILLCVAVRMMLNGQCESESACWYEYRAAWRFPVIC